jgi:hypothetical protein
MVSIQGPEEGVEAYIEVVLCVMKPESTSEVTVKCKHLSPSQPKPD